MQRVIGYGTIFLSKEIENFENKCMCMQDTLSDFHD